MKRTSKFKSLQSVRETLETAKKAKLQFLVQMIRFPMCQKKVITLWVKDKDREDLKSHFKKTQWQSKVRMKGLGNKTKGDNKMGK